MKPLIAALALLALAVPTTAHEPRPPLVADVVPLPVPGAYVGVRPEREFWEVIRHSADLAEAVIRVGQRYGPFPIEFPNFVALRIKPDPVNEATGMPAVLVDVLVKSGPVAGRHTRPVWFSPLKYH